MGRKRSSYKFWYKNVKEGDHLEGMVVDEGIILKWILNSLDLSDAG